MIERAAGWDIAKAPVLGDQAYGDNTVLRERLHDAGLEYVLAVGAETQGIRARDDVHGPRASGRRGPPRTAGRALTASP